MRKLMRGLQVGLLVVGLLAMVATPTMAQLVPGGFADPLQLAASGVLIPFYNSTGGDVSFLEVASPVSDIDNFHLIFFDATCARYDSRPLDLTKNDLEIFDTRLAGPPGTLVNGLIAMATSTNGNDLIALRGKADDPATHTTNFFRETGVHSRVYWINATTGTTRIVEPIILQPAEEITDPADSWSPLRTAATFFALPEGGAARTTLYLICPKTTIQGANGTAVTFGTATTTGVFPLFLPDGNATGFPDMRPDFQTGFATGAISGRVYDLEELFIGDIVTNCDCNITKPITSISSAYIDFFNHPTAANGTYSEINAGGTDIQTSDVSFTGYRAMDVAGTFFKAFGRLSNGSRRAIRTDNPLGFIDIPTR